jgi:hypothetical protein
VLILSKTSIHPGKLVYIHFGLLHLLLTTIDLVDFLTMASHSQLVEDMFSETEWQRVSPFSAAQAASLAHTRTWDAKVDRQITIAHKLWRLASNVYLEDITQHAMHMEVRISLHLLGNSH